MEEDGEATGTSCRSWGGSNRRLGLVAPAAGSGVIPAGLAPTSYGESSVRFREERRGERCEEIVEGRPAFIGERDGAEVTAWPPSGWCFERLEVTARTA